MACSLIVYKNTIRNCSTALQAFLFRSISLYPFFSFFIKARILLQFLSQAFSIFLMFSPIFFRFHKCFNNFHLSKNILINKFFHWGMCFFGYLYFPAHGPLPGLRPWPPIRIYRPWPPISIYRPWPLICVYQPWPQICIYWPCPLICYLPVQVKILQLPTQLLVLSLPVPSPPPPPLLLLLQLLLLEIITTRDAFAAAKFALNDP